MEKTKTSFWELAGKYSIVIPIQQRDYAQGRGTSEVKTIRKNFLDKLHEFIEDDKKSLDFDFIYGTIKDSENGKPNFLPLDGQQRLTTLFLLHWYLATKEGEMDAATENLRSFTYETRASSTDFCKALIDNKVELPPIGSSLKQRIENAHWFFLAWKKDPTIKSMLVMLEAIHAHKGFVSSEGFFQKLLRSENCPVTFQCLPLGKYGLTDSLYIKMNARGKPLTNFENFKARFEQFLDQHHPDKKIYFAEHIDGKWTDFFWKHKDKDNLIDGSFMRFFYFITEMRYYHDPEGLGEKVPDEDFEAIKRVYEKAENIEFLFNSLDFLSDLSDVEVFFRSIFSKDSYQSGKVAMFDGEVNLFVRCLTDSRFGIWEKVLLYFILSARQSTPSSSLVDFIRITRNLLYQVSRLNGQGIVLDLNSLALTQQLISLTSIIGEPSSDSYQKLILLTELSGFRKVAFESEKEKAQLIHANPSLKESIHKLEDLPLLRGSLHNFDLSNNKGFLPQFLRAVQEIFSFKDNSVIIRAFLTIEDYAIILGGSNLGERWYFGQGENWHTILATSRRGSDKVRAHLPTFLKAYDSAPGTGTEEKLRSLINAYLAGSQERNWRYYFIKYHQMTSPGLPLYAWHNDFELRHLSASSLLAYHFNPYVRTVSRLIDDVSICSEIDCRGRHTEITPLKLKCNITLFCEEAGWRIVGLEDEQVKNTIVSQFGINQIDGTNEFLLRENGGKDRIQIAVAFAKAVSQSYKTLNPAAS